MNKSGPTTYQISYPAPGCPELAQRVAQYLRAAGLPTPVDAERGHDHGMYSPMAVAWPAADMPTVQLSLLQGLNPAMHVQLGRALAPLRDEGVLLVGSGLSYRNLRAFGPQAADASAQFDAWLHQALKLPAAERIRALLDWEQAPAARLAHPREEHLLPLMFAVGAAEEAVADTMYHERNFMGGVVVSSFRFGAPAC